ncbi:MAG: DUF1223 domain-containing protein [Bryobacteraceae bacterium]
MIRPLALGLLGMTLCFAQPRAAKALRPGAFPVVVELFTSEGCSSCPAADAILARLDREGVIIMGEHVDYWDNLGWKDRFSSPLFSSRQQDYGTAMKNGTIYTPQAVINGEKEVLGSDARAIDAAIRDASRRIPAEVQFKLSGEQNVSIQVGKLPPNSHKADVLLAVTETALETNVASGENGGHKLRHAAVVRSLSRLAELDPKKPGEYVAEARLNLNPEWNRANLKLVLLVQDRENRHILGAATLKPKP